MSFIPWGERFRGYIKAMEKYALDPWVYRTEHRGESVDSLADWLQRPDGQSLFFAGDTTCILN
ncbi:hypothetical protein [Oceanispirochaeta sp.]|uniref:hypothetical protein n=1 Tax=Oceanispirochaeta sp. TaxID=2035350 RepID=UPI00261EFD66|nr:hypothetical protein [Oceanispirochaeta sp.]MDA3958648.1 hypothetical protein [Oceanispirochaeta sp.]